MRISDWSSDVCSSDLQENALVASDTLRLYEAAIAGLPERTRMVFLLQRADDLTYRQIAKRLGVTLWTVEYHMKRAITHLDRMLADKSPISRRPTPTPSGFERRRRRGSRG